MRLHHVRYIAPRLYVWYDRNVNNVPSLRAGVEQMACRVLYYTTASGERRLIIPVLECGDLYSYTVPSFPVVNVKMRRIKYQVILPDGESTKIVDGFIREDPSLQRAYPIKLSIACVVAVSQPACKVEVYHLSNKQCCTYTR